MTGKAVGMREYLVKLECGFYFHLLDIDEQLLYKRIGAAVTTRKETLCIRYANKSIFRKVCTALRYDNPEFFYWDAETSSITDNVIILKYRFGDSQEILNIKQRLREIRRSIEETCLFEQEYSTEKCLEMMYRFLVNNVKYAYEELQKPECTKWIYDIEGCLGKKRAVCLGIAQAVQYICRQLSITSVLITGKAELNGCKMDHAWNLVKIGDRFRHIDATCEICEKKERYQYFLMRDKDIAGRNWRKDIYPSAQ